MRTISRILFAVVLLFAAHPAKADLYLEPYLGYGSGELKLGSSTYTMSGSGIGARVGFSLPIFFVAADYAMGSGKANLKSGSGSSGDYSSSDLFAVVGARLPLIRAYAGYGLMNSVTAKGNGADSTLTGTAMKFGVGFSGLPFVAINLEYITETYNKLKSGGAEYDIKSGGIIDKASAGMYMLTVSLPLTF